MTRTARLMVLAVALGALPVSHSRADDDPIIYKKKASEWAEMLGKPDKFGPKLRRAAIFALSSVDPLPSGALTDISRALSTDPDAEVRREAAAALRNLGDRARDVLDSLADAMRRDKDDLVRQTAVIAIGRIKSDDAKAAVGPLAEVLKDKFPGVRVAAAETLGKIGTASYDAGPALLEALKDPEASVRLAVVQAMSTVRYSDDASIPALAEVLLKDESPDVRERAAEVLGQVYGAKAVPAVAALTEAVKESKDPKNPGLGVRRKAASALRKLGPDARPALDALREVVRKESDPLLVSAAIHAIGGIGPDAKEAVPELLVKCAIEVTLEIRLAAVSELGRIGPDAKAALPRLKEMQREGRTDVREAASLAVKRIEAPAPEPAPPAP